jgi:hypothetical protein
MQRTKIEVLNLQNKAIELRTVNKLSYQKIAEKLTKYSGQTITYDVVRRFFALKEKDAVEVAAKSDKLTSKIVETELDTVNECMKNLQDCQKVFDKAFTDGDMRAAILAIAERWKGIDMINKVLGKYKNLPELVNNVSQANVFVSIDQKVKEYEKYFTEIESDIDSDSA